MTIASAFNEIAVANGGQADTSGTIAGAVDALTDALAGSDVAQGATIEDGVRVLGEYISGGGGGSISSTVYRVFDKSASAPVVGGIEPDDESYNIGQTLYGANDVICAAIGNITVARAGFYFISEPNNVPNKIFAIAFDDDELISEVEELPVNTRPIEGESLVFVQLPDNSIGASTLVFMVGMS